MNAPATYSPPTDRRELRPRPGLHIFRFRDVRNPLQPTAEMGSFSFGTYTDLQLGDEAIGRQSSKGRFASLCGERRAKGGEGGRSEELGWSIELFVK